MLNLIELPKDLKNEYDFKFWQAEEVERLNSIIKAYNGSHDYHRIPIEEQKEQAQAILIELKESNDILEQYGKIKNTDGSLEAAVEKIKIAELAAAESKARYSLYQYFEIDENWKKIKHSPAPEKKLGFMEKISEAVNNLIYNETKLPVDPNGIDGLNKNIDAIKKAWQRHSAFSQHTSADLVKAKNLLLDIEAELDEEYDKIRAKLKEEQKKWWSNTEFVNSCELYMDFLALTLVPINAEKHILAQAMFERLKLSFKSKQPGYDDVGLQLLIDLLNQSANLTADNKKNFMHPLAIRKDMNSQIGKEFIQAIQLLGSADLKDKLEKFLHKEMRKINSKRNEVTNTTGSFKTTMVKMGITNLIIPADLKEAIPREKIPEDEISNFVIDVNLLKLMKEFEIDAAHLPQNKLDFLATELDREFQLVMEIIVEQTKTNDENIFKKTFASRDFLNDWKAMLEAFKKKIADEKSRRDDAAAELMADQQSLLIEDIDSTADKMPSLEKIPEKLVVLDKNLHSETFIILNKITIPHLPGVAAALITTMDPSVEKDNSAESNKAIGNVNTELSTTTIVEEPAQPVTQDAESKATEAPQETKTDKSNTILIPAGLEEFIPKSIGWLDFLFKDSERLNYFINKQAFLSTLQDMKDLNQNNAEAKWNNISKKSQDVGVEIEIIKQRLKETSWWRFTQKRFLKSWLVLLSRTRKKINDFQLPILDEYKTFQAKQLISMIEHLEDMLTSAKKGEVTFEDTLNALKAALEEKQEEYKKLTIKENYLKEEGVKKWEETIARCTKKITEIEGELQQRDNNKVDDLLAKLNKGMINLSAGNPTFRIDDGYTIEYIEGRLTALSELKKNLDRQHESFKEQADKGNFKYAIAGKQNEFFKQANHYAILITKKQTEAEGVKKLRELETKLGERPSLYGLPALASTLIDDYVPLKIIKAQQATIAEIERSNDFSQYSDKEKQFLTKRKEQLVEAKISLLSQLETEIALSPSVVDVDCTGLLNLAKETEQQALTIGLKDAAERFKNIIANAEYFKKKQEITYQLQLMAQQPKFESEGNVAAICKEVLEEIADGNIYDLDTIQHVAFNYKQLLKIKEALGESDSFEKLKEALPAAFQKSEQVCTDVLHLDNEAWIYNQLDRKAVICFGGLIKLFGAPSEYEFLKNKIHQRLLIMGNEISKLPLTDLSEQQVGMLIDLPVLISINSKSEKFSDMLASYAGQKNWEAYRETYQQLTQELTTQQAQANTPNITKETTQAIQEIGFFAEGLSNESDNQNNDTDKNNIPRPGDN